MPVANGFGDRQDRLLSDQRLTQDARKEAGSGFVGSPRTDADGGQPDPDAVEESATGVIGEQKLSDCLLGAVAGERRFVEVLWNGIGQWSAVDSNRGSEDETRLVTAEGARRPDGLEQAPSAVEIDPVTLLEFGLSLTRHDRREMEDHIRMTLHQPVGLARRREICGDQLDPTSVACRLLREDDVGQRQPFDGATGKVAASDQPGSKLTTDHAGRAQDQDVHNTSLPQARSPDPRLPTVAQPLEATTAATA